MGELWVFGQQKGIITLKCVYIIYSKKYNIFFAFVSWICFVCSPWSRFSVFTNVAIGKKQLLVIFQEMFIVAGKTSCDSIC